MTSRNFNPRSIYQNKREIIVAQPTDKHDKSPFSSGAYQDLDGSRIPQKGVHTAKNYHVHPWGLEARGGHKQWSTVLYPFLTAHTGMTIRKVGDIVIRENGGIDFTSSLVGSFIVYDDGHHEKIIGFESASRLQVEFRSAHALSVAAYIRGPRNSYLPHIKKGLLLLHIDTRLFYAEAEDVTAWTEIYRVGTSSAPSNTLGQMVPYGDHAILGNDNGLYFIDLNNFNYFQLNTAVPTVRLTEVAKSPARTYCRNYVYSLSRITGAGANGNRYTSGAELLSECGTNSPTGYRDYAAVYTERPVGEGSTYFALLTGGSLVAPYNAADGWNEIENGQFTITLNGTVRVASCNFVGCNSMADVAERVQAGLRDFVINATCEYDEDHFVITLPDEGSTISVTTAGPEGTDIGTAAMSCQVAVGLSGTSLFAVPATISELTMPVRSDNSLKDQHWTHYSLKGSLDAGENGVDPVSGEGNNPQLLMWIEDIPVAKSFVALVSGEYVSLSVGTFVKGEEGCTLDFADGSSVILDDYISPTLMTHTTSTTIASQPAAIGGGRVMTVQQSGSILSRTAGASWQSTDVGMPVFLATGVVRYVKSYIGSNDVVVDTSGTVASTGATIDPVSRKWTDTLRDDFDTSEEDLRSRIKVQYIAQNRLYTPLPTSEVIAVSPNKLFSRSSNTVHYSAFDVSFRHLVGYHYELSQREVLSQPINEMSVVNDILTIKSNHETRGIDLNSERSEVIDALGTAIVICSSNYMIDEEKGVKHFSSLCRRGKELQIVITGEPGIRYFDGREYGDNLATDRIQKTLDQLETLFSCWYDPVNGFTFNARRRIN